MKLKRCIENGQVVFRNAATNEIVDVTKKSSGELNVGPVIFYFFGLLIFILGIVGISKLQLNDFSIIAFILCLISALPFFFFGKVLDLLTDHKNILESIDSKLSKPGINNDSQDPKSYFDKK